MEGEPWRLPGPGLLAAVFSHWQEMPLSQVQPSVPSSLPVSDFWAPDVSQLGSRQLDDTHQWGEAEKPQSVLSVMGTGVPSLMFGSPP